MCILRGVKDVSWGSAKIMMADTQFLRGLIDYDKDSLSEKTVWFAPRDAKCISSGCQPFYIVLAGTHTKQKYPGISHLSLLLGNRGKPYRF